MATKDDDKLGPWELMQGFDADRFGADIFDREQQTRWSRAVFVGGLPYMWRQARPVLDMIYDLAEIKAGDKVLLFGESLESCGFIADIEKLVGPSGEVKSIDIQDDARDAVFAQQRGVGGMIGTFRYDYTSDIADEAYDIVLNLQGTQHTDDWTETGREFLRIMKSGRRLVMGEITLGSPLQMFRVQADLHIQHLFDKLMSRFGYDLTELPYYSADDLKRAFGDMLQDTGDFEWRGLEVFWGRKP